MRVVLVLSSGLPFFFFWHAYWMDAALLGYLMTAALFGLALPGSYPPIRTNWFWKTLVVITAIHSAIVFVFVYIDLQFPFVNKMPRVLYGFVGITLIAEWRLSVWIIDALEPKGGEPGHKHHSAA